MCGICGAVGFDPLHGSESVRAMARAIAHRGPDDEGIHAEPGAALGNRRLAIIDIEGGRQPLANEDESVWITLNGEIYNYRDIRARLLGSGHRFRTQTDTETIVHLYEERGAGCLDELRGMFAFALWDRNRSMLFAARDRFGQKPLFYTQQDGRLIFASEVKALLALPEVAPEPEPAAIDYYLTFRFVPAPLTMFRGVYKLPAGHYLTWHDGALSVEPYWSQPFHAESGRSGSEWIHELGERVEDAVRSHLVSDVPVGAMLSGGIDSSIVVAVMSRHLDTSFPTFCIGSDVEGYDERPFALQVAEACQTRHQTREVSASQLLRVARLVRCLDEPSDPIAACFYEASRLAAEHVKVVLGGDGGDEMFAGFDRYAAFRLVGWYHHLPEWIRKRVLRPAVERLKDSFAYKGPTQKARWLVAVDTDTESGRYARMNSFFRFDRESRDALYGPALAESLRGHEAEEAVVRPFEEAPADDALGRMLHTDMVTRLPEHTLMLADRLSMAHGLELRAPLLDHELAEFCARMPSSLKIHRGVTKYAMRQAARAYLPPEIVERPKQGFMFPVAHWLNRSTAPEIQRVILEGPLVKNDWIRPEAVQRLVGEHLARRNDHHVRIWMLQNLDAWYRIYLEGATVGEVAEAEPAAG